MRTVDPASGNTIAEYPPDTMQEVLRKAAQAEEAYEIWSRTSFEMRSKALHSVAKSLRAQSAAHAALISQEMGKPIVQAEAEIEKCAWCCEHYADWGERYLREEVIQTDAARSRVVYQPLGTILAIMPWNFPFWQFFRFAAPALMAGNAVLLKHASNVTGCALAIEKVFSDLPKGLVSALLLESSEVAQVIAIPSVRAVTLTGSERAGQAVASEAGKHLKKCVLELGGSDPFLVLSDANLEKTTEGAIAGRTQNTGQSCIAAKRFIVMYDVYETFCEQFTRAMEALNVGDPKIRETQIGPLAREDLLEELDKQVSDTVAAGGVLLCGGRRLPRQGWFYEPTVIRDVLPGMRAFDEETFGPVATITIAESLEHAVSLANTTKYGLGASLWTSDSSLADDIAKRLECGSVFVNGIVKSDPRLPFGGVKASGYGRELGRAGILEFVNQKTIWER